MELAQRDSGGAPSNAGICTMWHRFDVFVSLHSFVRLSVYMVFSMKRSKCVVGRSRQ